MIFKAILILLLNLLVFQELAAEEWPFLDISKIGATDFIKKHPKYDGKETVIIILDTGVDMGVAGLTETPDSSVKVIDAVDFSGEGDLIFAETEKGTENGEFYLKSENSFKLFGYRDLEYEPVDSVYFIADLDEDRFKNTVVPDINNNGRENDRFSILVFQSVEGWIAYIDLDADGNINDEQPIWDYKKKLQSFNFRGRDSQEARNLATFALNIYPEEKRVNLHYDGSSHGTHVAGIAAGYNINGQKGLNGIAPGAKIISLKIGDCTLSGGATTTGSMIRAYEYGIEFAKNHDGPVVFNMSFGIGSEVEGFSVIDLTLDDLLIQNEELVFCTSAGNDGPGISTVGLPAAAKRILTVGALNTVATANNVYGAHLSSDKLFVFSSRGGELNKPDIIAPGGVSSTIPPYSSKDVKWGTSMASPQVAGAVALLMSAAHQQNLPINGAMLKKALKNSAQPLKDYLPLEQGSGIVNIPKAFEYYTKLIDMDEQNTVLDYDVSTVSPVYELEDGRAAYWRFGSYLPDKNHKQRFYINPVFPEHLSADATHNFYRGYNLKSTADWLRLNKKSTYIKGDGPAIVDVYFDKNKLKTPGLYNAKIIASRKGKLFTKSNPENREFELMCTAVVPQIFNEDNKFSWESGKQLIKQGDVKRFFLDIPFLKASSANITLSAVDNTYADLRGYLYDPAGRKQKYTRIQSDNKKTSSILLNKSDLERGTWEFDVYADFRNEQVSAFKVSVSFSGLESDPETVSHVSILNGSNPEGTFKVLNHYDDLVESEINGGVLGIQRNRHISDSSEQYEYSFSVDKSFKEVRFGIDMDAEVFNLFTDFAVNIKDYSGNIIHSDGLSYKKQVIKFIPLKAGDYLLELVPAFASHQAGDWDLMLKESYYFSNKTVLNGGQISFYPRVEKEVDFIIDGQIPVAPEGFYLFGEIWLDSHKGYPHRTIIPIKLFTGLDD